LYLSYYKIPKKVFVNQIFPITIKIVVTEDSYDSLSYNFENGENILPVYTQTPEKTEGIYIYKTFYFKSLDKNIKLPDIKVYLLIDQLSPVKKETLFGKSIKAIKLKPPKDFCGVLANDLNVTDIQGVQYDREQNLIVLNIESSLSNLEDFHLNFVNKEGIEELNTSSFPKYTMTYFAIVPKDMKNFHFSYFNTQKNDFEKFSKILEIKDESVSTQTDINPSENSHKIIKFTILISLATLFLILAIYKRSFFYLFFGLLIGIYIVYISIPLKEICVKQNSQIRLLPTKNSTIFYKTQYNFKTKKLNSVNGYIKIRLPNGKIGWVKDENICKD